MGADEASMQDVSKDVHVGVYVKADAGRPNARGERDMGPQAALSGGATLKSEGLTRAKADTWFSQLCCSGSSKDTRHPRAKMQNSSGL